MDENTEFALRKAFELLERGVSEGWVDLTFDEDLRSQFDCIREALHPETEGARA